MPGFDSWESYFYPETYDSALGFGTLRNKFGERDFFALRELEYAVTAVRDRELHAGLVPLERTYGVEHLQAIHRHLFQDVYDWAGEFRTVNMAKPGGVGFARTRNGEAGRMIDAVQEYIGSEDWSRFDRDGFSKNAAVVFAFLNQAHPFREGNGRTSKIFMHHVSELSKFSLDFSLINADDWNRASALSSPTAERNHIDPIPLVSVFRTAAVERSTTPPAAPEAPVRDLRSASYPRPAQETSRGGSGASARPYRSQPGRGAGGPHVER